VIPAYAREVADRTLDLALLHGTTTLCSFCTIHPGSVDAFFEAAAARGMRVAAGKTCMDRDTRPRGCATPPGRPTTTARR
jgi:guanine deaminase